MPGEQLGAQRATHTAPKQTFKELKLLEREPLRYCKCDGDVTFTRPFLILGKVTFDEHVNALEMYWKSDILLLS